MYFKSKHINIVFISILMVFGNCYFSYATSEALFSLQRRNEGYRLVIENGEHISYRVLPSENTKILRFQFNNIKLLPKPGFPLMLDAIKTSFTLEKDKSLLSLMSLSPIIVKRIFFLKPTTHENRHRLVIDIDLRSFITNTKENHYFYKKKENSPAKAHNATPFALSTPRLTPKSLKPSSLRPLIILDPGHGGVDPGSIGPRGTKEKDVTLAFAKTLEALLLKTQCYRVYMTRDGDYFISVRDRLHKARELQGDLFISLHADSNPDPRVRGISIYTLSEEAANEHTKTLATQSKHHLLMNKTNVLSENEEVTHMLLDLVKRDTANRSSLWATFLMEALSKEAFLLNETKRSAGFKVLKGLNTPSLLVELGQISHKAEELLLNDADYHYHLSKMIAQSIERYLAAR